MGGGPPAAIIFLSFFFAIFDFDRIYAAVAEWFRDAKKVPRPVPPTNNARRTRIIAQDFVVE